MKWELVLILCLLFNTVLISGQRKTDFEIMVDKTIETLYRDPDAAIRSCKNISIKPDQYHENLIIKSILAEAFSLKGNYVDAVQITLENVNNPDQLEKKDQLLINLGVMQSLQNVNLHEQSEILMSPILKDLSQQKNKKGYKRAKLYQLHSFNLLSLKNYNKALENISISNEHIQFKSPESYVIHCENKILAGKIYFQKEDYQKAEKLFEEALTILKAHPSNNYLFSAIYLNQSDILFAKKEYQAATELLEKALAKADKADFLTVKNKIYAGLAKNYLFLKENEKHREFQTKHDESQTIIDDNRNEAVRNIMKLNQGFQNQNYNAYISKKQQQNFTYFAGSLLLISIFVLLNYQERQKKKMLEKQVLFFKNQKATYKQKETEGLETEKKCIKKALVIPKEKEDELLQKLKEFEESTDFLTNNMSLALLAAQLETNTKYLSEVINKFKGKNFTTYINELKINHIAYLISSDITYRQYKISYLAEYTGFASHSTFTVVFKSVTGISPNDYIQQVKKRESR